MHVRRLSPCMGARSHGACIVAILLNVYGDKPKLCPRASQHLCVPPRGDKDTEYELIRVQLSGKLERCLGLL